MGMVRECLTSRCLWDKDLKGTREPVTGLPERKIPGSPECSRAAEQPGFLEVETCWHFQWDSAGCRVEDRPWEVRMEALPRCLKFP